MFFRNYTDNTPKIQSEVQDFSVMTYPFKNIPLPYGYAGLEPYIDRKTMQLHHDKHLQKYIDTLNATLAPYPEYHQKTLTELLLELNLLPHQIRTQVQRNAGGTYNHFQYFWQFSNRPPKTPAHLAEILTLYFGSPDNFKKEFSTAALDVFGSGYAWLVQNPDSSLRITTTQNQHSPVSEGLTPLLAGDVWEHAYYLKHYNDRGAYVDDFFKVVDWAAVEKRMR